MIKPVLKLEVMGEIKCAPLQPVLCRSTLDDFRGTARMRSTPRYTQYRRMLRRAVLWY